MFLVLHRYNDVATVQEFHQWLQGPFLGTAYGTGTFGGDATNPFKLSRYILGYGRKLGGECGSAYQLTRVPLNTTVVLAPARWNESYLKIDNGPERAYFWTAN